MTGTYTVLAQLAEQGLALALDGRWDELQALQAELDAHRAGLPATPPPDAAPALRRAHAACHQTTLALTQARVAAGRELAALRRGRTVVRGYGQLGAGTAAGLDVVRA